MAVVDRNRLKGNYGAAYVTARLSSSCLVRSVATDTDVGVDLYCESVQDDPNPCGQEWRDVRRCKSAYVQSAFIFGGTVDRALEGMPSGKARDSLALQGSEITDVEIRCDSLTSTSSTGLPTAPMPSYACHPHGDRSGV